MVNYADATRTPRTLTEREQRALLKVTGELVVGDRLLDARGRPVEIVEITRRQGVFRVYNFEVAGLHTYFVTRQALWSHNRNGDCPPGGGDDAAGGADDAVTGFRAVSRAEADDIARHGFRPDPSGRGFQEGKWFSESREGAETFRRTFSDLDDVVQTRVPRDVYERSLRHPNIDGTGPGFCVQCSDLPLLPKP